jgi:hypothetical protein
MFLFSSVSDVVQARDFSVFDAGKPINFLSSATRFYLRCQQANRMGRAKSEADLGRKQRAIGEIKKEILICDGCNIVGDFLNYKCNPFSFGFSGNYSKAMRLATSGSLSRDVDHLKNKNLWHLFAFGEFIFSNANLYKLKQFKTIESQAYLASLGRLLCELGLQFCQTGRISSDDKLLYFSEALSRSVGTVFAFADAENQVSNSSGGSSGNHGGEGAGNGGGADYDEDEENVGGGAQPKGNKPGGGGLGSNNVPPMPAGMKDFIHPGMCNKCHTNRQIFVCPGGKNCNIGCWKCSYFAINEHDGCCPVCEHPLFGKADDQNNNLVGAEDKELKEKLLPGLYNVANVGNCASCNRMNTFVFRCPNHDCDTSVFACVQCIIPAVGDLEKSILCPACKVELCCETGAGIDDNEVNDKNDDEVEVVDKAEQLKRIDLAKAKLPQNLKKIVKFGECSICMEEDRVIFDCPGNQCHSLGCINCIKKAKNSSYDWIYGRATTETNTAKQWACPTCNFDLTNNIHQHLDKF